MVASRAHETSASKHQHQQYQYLDGATPASTTRWIGSRWWSCNQQAAALILSRGIIM